jgi:hypothetical protein
VNQTDFSDAFLAGEADIAGDGGQAGTCCVIAPVTIAAFTEGIETGWRNCLACIVGDQGHRA